MNIELDCQYLFLLANLPKCQNKLIVIWIWFDIFFDAFEFYFILYELVTLPKLYERRNISEFILQTALVILSKT